jgi:hypothetical protein
MDGESTTPKLKFSPFQLSWTSMTMRSRIKGRKTKGDFRKQMEREVVQSKWIRLPMPTFLDTIAVPTVLGVAIICREIHDCIS